MNKRRSCKDEGADVTKILILKGENSAWIPRQYLWVFSINGGEDIHVLAMYRIYIAENVQGIRC